MPRSIFCTFDGTATALHVRGEGRAVLVEPAPFKDGHAASVFLQGATIEPGLANPRLEHPAPMAPVDANPLGRPFDVTYVAGKTLVIDIAQGAAPGSYQGSLPDGAACPPGWCRIAWAGEAKRIELARDNRDGFAIAGSFPFGVEPGESGAPVSTLATVEVWGASGELRCGDEAEHVEGQWTWTAGPTSALALRGPDREGARKRVWSEGGAFRVHIENDARPVMVERPPVRVMQIVAVVVAAIVIVALAVRAIWRRRAKKHHEDLGGGAALAVTSRKAPATSRAEEAPPGPLRVFVSYAPEDETYLDKLETSLAPLVREKRIETFSARDVHEGDEPAKVVAARLHAAEVILLLVSADYLASDACHDDELTRAIERHERGEARVIPILVRACDVTGHRFETIEGLPRAAPESDAAKAIASFESRGKPDEAWKDVEGGLLAVIAEAEAKREAATVRAGS